MATGKVKKRCFLSAKPKKPKNISGASGSACKPPTSINTKRITKSQPPAPFPLGENKLMSRVEFAFYQRLTKACPDFVILTQVSMCALIWPRNLPEEKKTAMFWRLSQQRVDFVVWNPMTDAVKLVIELDDKSHIGKEYLDKKRDVALRSAGVDVLRFRTNENITNHDLEAVIFERIYGYSMDEPLALKA